MGTALEKPFPAYKGPDSFIFVCYAHKDAKSVYDDLGLLKDAGSNIWYDEGIAAGKSWRAEIATAIQNADKFVFFISKASLVSSHCLREIDYALDHNIEIIPVYLDDATLPKELALVLNRVQALFKKTDKMYSEHLIEAVQSKSLAAHLPINQKSARRFAPPLIALSALLIAFFVWNQWGTSSNNTDAGSQVTSTAVVYDSYLKALGLLKRWDKDDNLDIAIDLLKEAYTMDPSFALAYARSAEALRIRYILSGDDAALDEASDAANQAASLDPDLAPVQAALSLIHLTKGNLDLANAAVKRAIAIDPNDAMTNRVVAKVYSQLGRIDDADAAFQKAVALDSENPTVLDSYGNFLYEQGRLEEAIFQWQSAIKQAADYYPAMINLGLAFNETLRFKEAIVMYNNAIDIIPSYMAYTNLGTVYGREGNFQAAADAYNKALDLDKSDSLAWGNLAFVYAWMNGMDTRTLETFNHAIKLAETIRQQYPRDAFIHSDLALYYAKTDQPTLALQRLRTATTLAPDSSEILSAAAEAYEILGKREEAIYLMLSAIEHGHSKQHLQTSPELKELINDTRLFE